MRGRNRKKDGLSDFVVNWIFEPTDSFMKNLCELNLMCLLTCVEYEL